MEALRLVILFIVTSHTQMGETGEPTGAWMEEVATPYYAFVDAGFDVVVASPKGGQTPFDPRSLETENQTESTKRFLGDPGARRRFAETIRLDQLPDLEYAAVFLPGGHGPMWDLAANETLGALIVEAADAGKPIGAVCHGPAGLLPAVDSDGQWIFAGKSITAFTNAEEKAVHLEDAVPFLLETEIIRKGGKFSKGTNFAPYVVKDGTLVTGQNPASSAEAANAILRLVRKEVSNLPQD